MRHFGHWRKGPLISGLAAVKTDAALRSNWVCESGPASGRIKAAEVSGAVMVAESAREKER